MLVYCNKIYDIIDIIIPINIHNYPKELFYIHCKSTNSEERNITIYGLTCKAWSLCNCKLFSTYYVLRSSLKIKLLFDQCIIILCS